MNAELLIAGIPADDWVGRTVKYWSKENKQKPIPCFVAGIINNGSILIKPNGQTNYEIVRPNAIEPTWTDNEDLKQKYAKFANAQAANPAKVQVVETAAEPVAEVDAKADTANQQLVISNHTADWLPIYQEYLAAVKNEATDKELLNELLKSIDKRKEDQERCIVQLAKMGVEIRNPDDEALDEATDEASEFKSTLKEVKRRTRVEMDRYIIDWGKNLRSKILSGERVNGTINYWADELGITWLAVQSRITMLNDLVGLTFKDEKGRTGSKARGYLTVGLKR